MALYEAGDVVVCLFPGVAETKRRPAVVLSSAAYHDSRPDVILGILTGATDIVPGAMDHALTDWADANLKRPSTFRSFVATLPHSALIARIGRLSDRDWQAVRRCVRRALGVDEHLPEERLGE